MADKYVDRKTLVTGLILMSVLIVAYVGIIYGPALVAYFSTATPPPSTYVYTQALSANFKIMDTSVPGLLTAGIVPTIYSSGANPFSQLSVDQPLTMGTVDLLTGIWSAVLDTGSYLAMLSYPAGFDYPALIPITVPGTNSTLGTVNLSPYVLPVTERSIVVTGATVYAYDNITYLYDIAGSGAGLNSSYSRWQITYTISAALPLTKIAAGYIYLTAYPGLTITSAKFNSATAALVLDTTGTQTGLTGYYVSFPDLAAGTVSTLNIQLTWHGAASGSYVMYMYEDGACNNPALRWWEPDAADTVTVPVA